MPFVQIIEYQTKRIDEIRELIEKFRADVGPDTAPARATVTKDLDRADTYISVVEFDSQEQAIANSQRPETGVMAKAMADLCDAPPQFRNLDVIHTL